MANTRQILMVLGMSLVAAGFSGEAFAASKRTDVTARANVRQLLQLMDRDKNGTVSRDEFLQYMGQTFDRLDVPANGQLEADESDPLSSANFTECTALAFQKGLIVGEREAQSDTGPAAWKEFMDSLPGRQNPLMFDAIEPQGAGVILFWRGLAAQAPDARQRSGGDVSSGPRNRHRRRYSLRPGGWAVLAHPPVLRIGHGI